MKRLALFYFLTIGVCEAQDVQFNNIDQSLISLNPSYAGSAKCFRNQTNYRLQWLNTSHTNLSYQTCFDGFNKQFNTGLALRVMSDEISSGTMRRTGIALTYAQYIKINKDVTVIPSVEGSYIQSTLDKGRLNYGDVIDARYGIAWNTPDIPKYSLRYSNLSAGLMVRYYRYLVGGVSFSNLSEPNIAHVGTYHLPIRTTIHARSEYPIYLDSHADVSMIATFQNKYYNIRANAIVVLTGGITYGLGYGESNSYYVLPGASTLFFKNVKGYLGYSTHRGRLIYSYDRNINVSSGNTAGSHEISLSILFRKKTERERFSI